MEMENGIWITQAELDVIGQLKGKPLQRLAFTLLCIAKRGNQKYQNNKCLVSLGANYDGRIRRLANFQHDTNNRYLQKVYELIGKGIIEFDEKESSADRVMFRVAFCENKSERVLYICNFNDLGNQYRDFVSGKYIICKNCGKIVENSKNNRRKYCEECQNNDRQEDKIIICKDCGHRYSVSSKDHKSCRCRRCQAKRDRENNCQRQIRYRERQADKISLL